MRNSTQLTIAPFLTLTAGLSVPFWILHQLRPIALLPGLPLSALAALAPSVSAVYLQYTRNGKDAAILLLNRSSDLRRLHHPMWLLAHIGLNPLVTLAAYKTMQLRGTLLPPFSPVNAKTAALLVVFFVFALGEEIGWSGYAVEPCVSALGTFAGGALLGAITSAWHVVPLLQAGRSPSWIAWWTLRSTMSRVVATWLYVRAGPSVVAAALDHAMSNLCWQMFPIHGSLWDPKDIAQVSLVAVALVGILDRLL
ncbi:hypothetical protein M427DRAFT_389895 [Gonapodya prolifera JEL478]|uniref:CAAX prenyl protease 2/Lysostaphin resistance protein A-like domain-containing protein n=1 Tax=Gonapodya prolifera (strain JEL478) TaxID=1344416 RepID=A0A139A833_GONPJ|nr:hypothetical protein M427DRAFT_389895 [Gonapodya prolifera JEL478]|eukprot:KXS12864.1 hypothetical protein M427DRAFT_389895 [Gonapodya prolifera JEL478]